MKGENENNDKNFKIVGGAEVINHDYNDNDDFEVDGGKGVVNYDYNDDNDFKIIGGAENVRVVKNSCCETLKNCFTSVKNLIFK